MSGVGFSELIILALIGLIVLGPERLPRVANQLGGWLGQARRMTRVMKRQLEDELDLEKAPDIRPPPVARGATPIPPKSSTPEPERVPANEHDDVYSPTHDADSASAGDNKKDKHS